MKAVVMAGGEGSRLRPLTSRRPKPLAPVANKPVMHHIVDLLRRHGFTEIVSTLHYLADEIESYFGDGSEFGVKMHYVVEDTPLGTAGAVKLAQSIIGRERFLIISGDALTDLDLTAILAQHEASGAGATITLQRVANPLEFGVVVTDEHGRITRFLEKPSWGEIFSDTINTGIYVLEPEIFDYMDAGRVYDFSKDLFPRMLHEGKLLKGYITPEYWTDIGNLQQYQQANYDALDGRVRLEIAGRQTAPGIWQEENCRIAPDATLIAPVVLGKNVRIESGAVVGPNTTLGNSAIVATSARVHRTTAWEDCYLGEHVLIDGVTLASRNIVKDHVTIGEGSVIGSGCVLGSGTVVRPNIKLWPDKTVNSGAIVSMSLIYGIKWPGSLFGATGVSGIANVEITPEFAMKLGQAFGSSLKPGQTVMTSRDANPASRIMNRCIISGLLSVGVHVEDLTAYAPPLTRYAVRTGGDGGVHTRVSPDDPGQLLMEIFDAGGINVDKSAERKIENLFFREDFRRTAMEEVGNLSFPVRTLESYTNDFLVSLAPKSIASANFRIVVDYAYGNASVVLPRILNSLNVELISLNAYFDDARTRTFNRDRDRYMEQLRNVSSTLHADLGVLVDPDGETFALIDDKGRVIDGSKLVALLTLLVVRSKPGARIALPVTVPVAIEAIAQSHGATVSRTRSDRRAIMALASSERENLDFAAGNRNEAVFPEFHPAFDAFYGFAKALELLAAERRTLSELVDLLPEWHIAARRIACPWERKGAIMRTLLDEQNGGEVELIDGIRVRRDGGWWLVLPDASDPTLNVFAEGTNDHDADRFVNEVSHRIEQLVHA